MPYNRSQVENLVDLLNRSLRLDQKARIVETTAKLLIDEDEDLSITTPAQVTAYVTSRRTARDNIIAAVKPVVAAWTA